MKWLRRLRPREGNEGSGPGENHPNAAGVRPSPVEAASPGIAALVDELRQNTDYSVLDLGQASDETLRAYGTFSRWVRFAGLAGGGPAPGSRTELAARLPAPDHPYDLVFAWDVLDRMPPEARPRLVERLADVTAAGALLHVVVAAPERETIHPLRFTLLEVGRMRYERVGPAGPGWPRLLPAEVERLLEPFEVTRRFNLKGGLKEYVAARRAG